MSGEYTFPCTGPRLLDAFGDDKIHHLLTVAHAPTSSQVDSSTRDHKKVASWLYMKALATYKQALKAGQEEFTAGGDIQGMISGYVSLASFCDRALRAEEEKGILCWTVYACLLLFW